MSAMYNAMANATNGAGGKSETGWTPDPAIAHLINVM